MAKIVGRMESESRKLAVVDVGGRYSVRDVTHGESGVSGTADGIGRVLGNPYASLEYAMREAHHILFGVDVVPVKKQSEQKSDGYLGGNERALGMGPDEH